MSPGCPKRKIFISEISVREKGREGRASCAGGRGRRFFLLSLLLGGWFLVQGSPPSTEIRGFPADERAPGRRAGVGGQTRVCLFPPQGLGIQRGRGGRRGRARLARPRLAVGCPRGVPPPSLESWRRGKQEGFFFFFFYLRRGAGSGREGKVQAAGGRAPLSPMEGV